MSMYASIPGTSAFRKRRSNAMCKKVADHLQEIVDHELPRGRALKHIEEHLDMCPPCAKEADAFRELKSAIARVSSDADEQCLTKLHELAQRLCDEQNVD